MIILCLGNPGTQYLQNRHNVGFLFAEWIKNQDEITKNKAWKKDPYTHSDLLRQSAQLLIARPITYMNESGKSAKKILNKEQEKSEHLFVVHDDLDLRLGEYKISFARGPKLHGGVNSIESHLHTEEFWRVRIGVDNRDGDRRITGEEYVLQDFLDKEHEIVSAVFPKIWEQIQKTKFSDGKLL